MAVELQVNSQLSKIIEDLAKITDQSKAVGESLKDMGKKLADNLDEDTKKTKTFLQGLRDMGRNVADQLKKDFRSLLSINALSDSLKLSNQFRGAIKESIGLSDTIRKLGSVFGMTESSFAKFQEHMTRGLGAIGLSSEAAGNALKGLAETPVRGEANLIQYSKTAGELASITGQRGQEGQIAKGLAQAVTARGENPNDLKAVSRVSADVLRIRDATGKSATDALQSLNDLFSHANADFKKQLQGGGAVGLASASLLGGQDSTAFLEKYLGLNRISRLGIEAQGFGRIIGPQGQLNQKAIESTLREAKGRGLGDAQAGLKTFGFSDEEAQGFIRLAEAMRTNGKAIEDARNRVVDIEKAYRESGGMAENFGRSINKIGSYFSSAIAPLEQGATNLLGKASQSTGGAAAVVAGGGILAALLAGFGLKGIGKGLGGGLASGLASSAVAEASGKTVQHVWVDNIGMGGGLGGLPGAGIGAALPALATVGAAVAVGGAVVAAGFQNERQQYSRVTAPLQQEREKNNENAAILKEISSHLKDIKAINASGQKIKIEGLGSGHAHGSSMRAPRGSSVGP